MAAEHSQADRLRSIEQDLELGVAGANLVALPQPVVICAELSAEEYGDAVRHVAVRGGEEPGRQDASAAVDEGGVLEAAVELTGEQGHGGWQGVSLWCGLGT